MLPIATKEYYDALGRFDAHLPMGKDRELLILKGHLLIERMLERYLSLNLANPQELGESNFRFGQKTFSCGCPSQANGFCLAVACTTQVEPLAQRTRASNREPDVWCAGGSIHGGG
jgi:hypothetical protein